MQKELKKHYIDYRKYIFNKIKSLYLKKNKNDTDKKELIKLIILVHKKKYLNSSDVYNCYKCIIDLIESNKNIF